MGEQSGNPHSEAGLEVPISFESHLAGACVPFQMLGLPPVLTWGWESGSAQHRSGLSSGLGAAKGKARGRTVGG